MNRITEEMARKLYQYLPPEAQVAIETTTDNMWVTNGSGSGFFVSHKAMVDFPSERMHSEITSAWDALCNGAEKDEHGLRIIAPLELEQHHVNMVPVPREVGGEAVYQAE